MYNRYKDLAKFESFWDRFYYLEIENKHPNKASAKKLWLSVTDWDLKLKVFHNIHKYIGKGLTAYDVLKIELKN